MLHSKLQSVEAWLDSAYKLRRIVYLDGNDLLSTLKDCPIEIRLNACEIGLTSDIKVFTGTNEQPLIYSIESIDPKLGVVLRVWIFKIEPGDKQTIHIYYNKTACVDTVDISTEYFDADEIMLCADPNEQSGLRLFPKNIKLDSKYKAVLEDGFSRPAIRTANGEILRVQLPSELGKSENGWTIECLAYEDDPDVTGIFYGRSLVSVWGEGVGIVEDTENVSSSASGYKYDPFAWVPVENGLPLINFGLINYKPYSCTHKPNNIGENWQMPLFGKNIEPQTWHYYTAVYESGECRLYVDGYLQKTDYAAGDLSIGSLCIGSWNRHKWMWNGLIDSVRLRRNVLSEDAIKARAMSCMRDPAFIVISDEEKRDSTITITLSDPVKIAPIGLIRRYDQPSFRWSIVPKVKEYELTVWNESCLEEPVINKIVGDTRYQPDFSFEAGKPYKWNVKSIYNDNINSANTMKPDENCANFLVPEVPPADIENLDPPKLPGNLFMRPVDKLSICGEGPVPDRFEAAGKNWLLKYPSENPDIINALTNQNLSMDYHPWWGESFGKFMTGATLYYDLTRDKHVKAMLDEKIAEAMAAQEPDGYLGSYPKKVRLAGEGIKKENWDLYIIHHELTAFLEYYRITSDSVVLQSAMRLADLVCEEFGYGKANIVDLSYNTSSNNYCILGPMVALFKITGRRRYLEMAMKIVDEWENLTAGMEYISLANQKKHLTDMHYGHGFEMMVSFGHLIDLYDVTGEKQFFDIALYWWCDAVEREVQINGNLCPFSSEFYVGDPYAVNVKMETCAATAFMRFSLKVLQATGDSCCVDAIEKSLYNAHFAAQCPDGSNYLILTPLRGIRDDYRTHMTCCPAWGLTGMSSIRDWGALVTQSSEIVVNYFGDCTIESKLDCGYVKLEQQSKYPAESEVLLTVRNECALQFSLWIRIPAWSTNTQVWINSSKLPAPEPGCYLKLNRIWNPGDDIRIVLDFSPRIHVGKNDALGLAAFYRGPLLMSIDKRFNPDLDINNLPCICVSDFEWKEYLIVEDDSMLPWVLMETCADNGKAIVLSDYANSGATGTEYASWIPI